MSEQVCACCGQTLPPARPKDLRLSAGYALIFDRVHRAGKHGVNQQVLFDWVYGSNPNGGPDSGMVVLRTRICYLNKKLRQHGLEIRAPSGAGSPGYRLLNTATRAPA